MSENTTDSQVQQLFNSVNDIKSCLHDIRTAVVGNPELGQKGLVTRMESMEKWRTNLDLRIATITGVCITVGFIIKGLFFK